MTSTGIQELHEKECTRPGDQGESWIREKCNKVAPEQLQVEPGQSAADLARHNLQLRVTGQRWQRFAEYSAK